MFRHMKYIYAVYKAKNFSRAAESLYISQSSLSLTIKKAEDEIGAQIFNRSTTPVTLTEFGKLYINSLEEIMHLQDKLENFIYDVEHVNRGHVSIGAGNFYSTYILPPVISSFRKSYPNVTFSIYESATPDLIKKLVNFEIDVLLTKAVLDEKRFRKFAVCSEIMVLVTPKKFCPAHLCPLAFTIAGLRKLKIQDKLPYELTTLKEIKNTPFVLLRTGNDTRESADHLFTDIGIQPPIVLELDQASTAYRLSCSGMGATVVSNLIIEKMEKPKNMLFFPLNKQLFCKNIYAYIRSDAITPWILEEFIKIASFAIQDNL